jgi:hypothetical protein
MLRITRFRAVPWLLLLDTARTVQLHVRDNLDPDDRRRVADIARRTKGDPRRVTDREKADLKKIAGRLDLPGLGRSLLPYAGSVGRRRR